jgi:hypothetical protein
MGHWSFGTNRFHAHPAGRALVIQRARQVELRAAALKVWRFASIAALAGAKHVSNGWSGLQGAAGRKAQSLESPVVKPQMQMATLERCQISVYRDQDFGWSNRKRCRRSL